MDERRNGPAQVQQRVQLDGRLGGLKRRPVEQAQAQIDGGGVQGVDGVVQLQAQRFAGVELARSSHQHHRQGGPNTPIAGLVRIGQRRALHRRAKAHRVELVGVGRQAQFDVAQALAPGQLRIGHGAELFSARQLAHARVAAMALHDARKAAPGYELHELSEKRLACVHVCSPEDVNPGKLLNTQPSKFKSAPNKIGLQPAPALGPSLRAARSTGH